MKSSINFLCSLSMNLQLASLFALVIVGQRSVFGGYSSSYDNEGTSCPSIDPDEIEYLFFNAKNAANNRRDLEQELIKQGKYIKNTEFIPDITIVRQPDKDPTNRKNELKQIYFEVVTNKVYQKYNLTREQVNTCLPQIPLNGPYSSMYQTQCFKTRHISPCNASDVFRTADGTCNNLKNPIWGADGNCMLRIYEPHYVGASGLRQSAAGGPLPPPRQISLRVHANLDVPTKNITHMFMFFAQFVDHEITQAPVSVITDNPHPIKCCEPGRLQHPQCIPILLGNNDKFFSKYGTTCLNMVRMAMCPTCKLGPRDQVNQITSFVDASQVYGTTASQTNNLRANDGSGRMLVQKSRYGDLVPPHPNPYTDHCSLPETNDICFNAGDPRANEHPPLSSLHTLFLRHHNQLADGIRELQPSWKDELIFQTTRRIMGATMQQLIYGEFLPLAIGREYMQRYKLYVGQSVKHRTRYNPKINPSTINSFNAAAYRFGHTLINSVLGRTPLNSTGGQRLLRDQYFQGFDLHQGILDSLMKSVCTDTPAQEFDRYMVLDVTDFLYRIRGTQQGLDLASINIQRGRDQGLPSYTDMVKHCSGGNDQVTSFDYLVEKHYIPQRYSSILRANYKSVHDVDLWTALIGENHLEGAVVGKTTACIIGEQFHNLKYGDRFYFEHKNQVGSLTDEQLQDIKKVNLASILCLNSGIDELANEVLLFPSETNPIVSCSKHRENNVNLELWAV